MNLFQCFLVSAFVGLSSWITDLTCKGTRKYKFTHVHAIGTTTHLGLPRPPYVAIELESNLIDFRGHGTESVTYGIVNDIRTRYHTMTLVKNRW